MTDDVMREALRIRALLARDLDELRLFQDKFLKIQRELRALKPGEDERAADICRLMSNTFTNTHEIMRASLGDLRRIAAWEQLAPETRQFAADLADAMVENFLRSAVGLPQLNIVKIEEDPS